MEIHVNGFEMHYDLCGDPAGEPLLWIHGFGGSGADWKYIFKEVPAGYRQRYTMTSILRPTAGDNYGAHPDRIRRH
jgi:pimeloyl-ACP methyl ester carboxylesterase